MCKAPSEVDEESQWTSPTATDEGYEPPTIDFGAPDDEEEDDEESAALAAEAAQFQLELEQEAEQGRAA